MSNMQPPKTLKNEIIKLNPKIFKHTKSGCAKVIFNNWKGSMGNNKLISCSRYFKTYKIHKKMDCFVKDHLLRWRSAPFSLPNLRFSKDRANPISHPPRHGWNYFSSLSLRLGLLFLLPFLLACAARAAHTLEGSRQSRCLLRLSAHTTPVGAQIRAQPEGRQSGFCKTSHVGFSPFAVGMWTCNSEIASSHQFFWQLERNF